ncbi:MAG: hypothetical protein AAFP77_29505 [Bacteroidota bacterium]
MTKNEQKIYDLLVEKGHTVSDVGYWASFYNRGWYATVDGVDEWLGYDLIEALGNIENDEIEFEGSINS